MGIRSLSYLVFPSPVTDLLDLSVLSSRHVCLSVPAVFSHMEHVFVLLCLIEREAIGQLWRWGALTLGSTVSFLPRTDERGPSPQLREGWGCTEEV